MYDKAKKQRKISNTCMYISASIWVIDLGITIINTQQYNKHSGSTKKSNISLGYYFDPNLHDVPLLSLQYNL